MSLLSIVSPVEFVLAAQALAETLADAAPLLGFGALIAVLMVFKQRQSLEEGSQNSAMHDTLALNQMARELDAIEPSLAAELRLMASHG